MSYALGIDLGTTFTAAGVARGGRVEIVSLGNHAAAIPSAVLLREDGELLVGDAAVRRGQQEPARLAKEFKRRLGDATPIILGNTPYSSERLMAMIVQWVVTTVSERNGGPPSSVVIAHPANWGPYKRELLQQAASLAGVSNARFVTEPEAAAVHFAAGERVDEGGIVAVYDLGGGTFDAAVLRRSDGGFITLGEPQGIERLGGIDFDEAVMSHVRQTLGDALSSIDGSDPAVRSAMLRLRAECVAAKEALSDDSEAVISVMLPGLQTQVRITRLEFENMIRPTLRETVTMLRRAIDLAGTTTSALSAVVLAGGSSRIPLVAEMVAEAVGRPVAVDAHPKHTVALGAARIAADSGGPPQTAAPAAAPAAPPLTPAAPAPAASAAPAVAAAGGSGAAATRRVGDAPPPSPTSRVGSQGQPPSPPGPTSAEGPAPVSASTASGKRSWGVAIIAVVLIAAVAIAAAVLMLGGDDGGGDDAVDTNPPNTTTSPVTTVPVEVPPPSPDTNGDDAGDTTVSPSTTAPASTLTCPEGLTRCVRIDSISESGDELVARYSTGGFTPQIDGGPESFHIHFYFDTLPVELAGAPAPAEWTIWDVDPETGELLYRFGRSDIPDGASQLCASVANVNHGLPDVVQDCVPLP